MRAQNFATVTPDHMSEFLLDPHDDESHTPNHTHVPTLHHARTRPHTYVPWKPIHARITTPDRVALGLDLARARAPSAFPRRDRETDGA